MSYEALMGEVECIREAWGYNVLEAIMYIDDHREDYIGTKVYRELRLFLAEGAKLFAPLEESV